MQFKDASGSSLVRWALEYLEDHAGMLERSYTDEYGRIRPAETRAELKIVREWCQRARELLVETSNRRRLTDLEPKASSGPTIQSVSEAASVIGSHVADPLKRWPGNQA
jgi:hypothetical protein